MSKKTFCVVIPAFNEEQVITTSLRSLKKIVKREDIFVVSDGSKDSTVSLAKKEKVNVMALRINGGKAIAQDKIIQSRKLTKRYKYILFSDADSSLNKDFGREIRKMIKYNPALIVGTVTSDKKGLISAFRTYEYGLSHRIYKSAQNAISSITVAPGCASLYRNDVLEKLELKSPTLTEDFDLTIQIHQKKLGRIIYAPLAKVTTQDPLTLGDYWKQITRWNTGTWQNIFRYKLYKPNSKLNLELYFLLLDNLLWIATFIFAVFYPMLFLNMLFAMLITVSSLSLIIAIIERKFWIIPYIPCFPIFYFMNIGSYYYSIVRAIKGRNKVLQWNKVSRYSNT